MTSRENSGQTMITINEINYSFKEPHRCQMRAFIAPLQVELQRSRYPLTSRMYKIAAYAVGDEEVRGLVEDDQASARGLRGTYDTWEQFITKMAENDLVAPRARSYVRFRPRTLGLRPGWFPAVDCQRERMAGLAIRHIVPSHLLGYAAEHLQKDVLGNDTMAQLEENFSKMYAELAQKAGLGDEANGFTRITWDSQSVLVRRRRIWALLNNHPGNLWVGDSAVNSTIGLLHGAVASAVVALEKIEIDRNVSPSPRTVDAVVKKSLPKMFLTPRVGIVSLRDEIVALVHSVVHNIRNRKSQSNEDDTSGDEDILTRTSSTVDPKQPSADGEEAEIAEPSDLEELVEVLDDIAANLDLDTPELTSWPDVVWYRERFQQDLVEINCVMEFLAHSFAGSLSTPYQ